jgi:outer membrane protein TolC
MTKASIILFVLCVARVSFGDERISLEQFLSEATAQNLSLKISAAAFEAEKEGSYGIKLPPPQASVLQMRMDAGSGSGFTVSQSIPFPTKITSEHSARKAEAASQKEESNAQQARVTAAAKFLYFRLWEASERMRLLSEKTQIIEHHIKLAQAAARSDSFLKIHVIKAENDLDLLKNSLLQAEQNIRERQIEAANFLNRNPEQYRPLASEFPPSLIPEKKALARPHQLEVKKFALENLKAKESEAQSKWFPDLTFQYKQMGATPMWPHYSEVMVGVTLPFVFFWEPRAESAKAAARRLEGEYLLEKEKRQIETEKTTSIERAVSLKKQLDQFANELLPRAEKRMKIVNNLAPRDMETLQDQRETLEAFPDLKLKALEVREQYEQSIAEVEKFRSGELP